MLVRAVSCESLVGDELTEGGFGMADCDAGVGRVSSGILMNTLPELFCNILPSSYNKTIIYK